MEDQGHSSEIKEKKQSSICCSFSSHILKNLLTNSTRRTWVAETSSWRIWHENKLQYCKVFYMRTKNEYFCSLGLNLRSRAHGVPANAAYLMECIAFP